MESNYLLFHEHMNYSMLYKLHALGMNMHSPFTQYNRENGELSGVCEHHLEPSLAHLKHLGKVTGFSAINYYAKDVLELIASLDTNQRNDYFDALNDDLQRLGHQAVPHYDGSVTYFDWENIPKIYLFSNPREPLTPVYIPSFGFNQNEEKHHSTTDNDDKYQSALDPASHNHLKAEHMLQARLQQEAEHGHGHNDDNDEPKPTKPTPPTDDDNSSLQQGIKQQQQAIDDDDDDEKKKRDRRLQKQRNRQRQSQQQSKADQYDNNVNKPLSPEWQQAVNKYLAHEKAVQDALKHPKPKRWNGSNSGSRGGRNGRSYHPTNNGPSI